MSEVDSGETYSFKKVFRFLVGGPDVKLLKVLLVFSLGSRLFSLMEICVKTVRFSDSHAAGQACIFSLLSSL